MKGDRFMQPSPFSAPVNSKSGMTDLEWNLRVGNITQEEFDQAVQLSNPKAEGE